MERRNALREVKARLHQASFRDAVLSAYGGRCAISPLPEPRLLDAAHIVMLGQPVVSNGLPLTKVHHAARPPATSRGELKSAYSKLNQCSTNQLFQNILNNLLAITANNTR